VQHADHRFALLSPAFMLDVFIFPVKAENITLVCGFAGVHTGSINEFEKYSKINYNEA